MKRRKSKPTFNSVFRRLRDAFREAERLSRAYEKKDFEFTSEGEDAYEIEGKIKCLISNFDHRKGQKP
jgi:hypothetical protein